MICISDISEGVVVLACGSKVVRELLSEIGLARGRLRLMCLHLLSAVARLVTDLFYDRVGQCHVGHLKHVPSTEMRRVVVQIVATCVVLVHLTGLCASTFAAGLGAIILGRVERVQRGAVRA